MLIFSRYTWWMGAMLGLTVLLAALGQVGALRPFQGAFLNITSPVENGLGSFFRPIASFLSDAGNINQLQDENAELRLRVEELEVQLIQAEQNKERIRELEEALNFNAGQGDTHLPANIVTRQSQAFTATASIDKGSSDGIRKGMVVLSTKGTLIGTVTTVLEDRSFIRLITDGRSKVAAEIAESKADGLVKGEADGALGLELAQAEIAVGDRVVTSGIGGNYPPGLPIGLVSEVSGTSQDLFRKVTVEPLVRISTVRTVLIRTSFVPQRIELDSP